MSDIPLVSFHKKSDAAFRFEILLLEKLFDRFVAGRLKHDIRLYHRVDFHNIIHIERGSGVHFVDFVPYPYEQGNSIFLSCGQIHAFEINPEAKGYVLIFTDDFLLEQMTLREKFSIDILLSQYARDPVIRDSQSSATISAIVDALYREYGCKENPERVEIVRLLLKALLIKIASVQSHFSPVTSLAEGIAIVLRLKELIRETSFACHHARRFAEMMGMSYKHLNVTCKAVSGRTAKQYIDRETTLEIQRFLVTTSLSIKELTDRFGFAEESNFVKYFSHHVGMSPKKFRDRYISTR